MPRVSQAYPSKNLSAADLNEQDLIITITGVESQAFDDDATKLVAYCQEVDKGFVLNKTNARTIAGMYGDDTDDWIGKRITLYPTWVDFQGKQTEAIRVRPKPPREAKKPAPAVAGKAKPMTQAEADEALGDGARDDAEDIPF